MSEQGAVEGLNLMTESDGGSELPAIPESESIVSQVRPWVRFWARIFDVVFFLYCIVFAIRVLGQGLPFKNLWVLGGFLILIQCLMEALLLATLGRTPGKALFRVSVSNSDGSQLNFVSALVRSLDVWLRGMGLGLYFIIPFLTWAVAYNTLTKEGAASWDSSRKLRVTHGKIGIVRLLLWVALFLGLLSCFFVAPVAR